MATKIMHVKSDGFLDSPLFVKKKNHDAVHFIQGGVDAPSTVTAPPELFEGGVTTCMVDPNAAGTHVYPVVAKRGAYEVNLPTSPAPTAMVGAGTIKVNG